MAGKITLGADHGGYALKEAIKKELIRSRYKVLDMGPCKADPCDYPIFGFEAAKKVAKGEAQKGVIICTSGIGMSMIANKLPGVRAALCRSEEDAVSSRQHNHANVLVLGARNQGQAKAVKLVKTWLRTRPLGGRHARRVSQIEDYEKKVFKKLR